MTKKQLQFILKQGENSRIEFKENLDKNVAKDICAFANSSGGQVLVGVDDNNQPKGIKITNRLKSQIQDLAGNCDPAIKVNLKESGNILIVEVPAGADKPYSCSSGFYLRQGSNSQKMNRGEILALAVDEGSIRFDEQICQDFIFFKDFDQDKFEHYAQEAQIPNILNVKDVLINLNAAKIINNKLKFNNAGVLFFAKNPQRFFVDAITDCILFKGNDRVEILDRKIFRTGLLEQLQEAIVNSLMHRDYFFKGAHNTVYIYDDFLEISNPGGLPKGLNKNDFGKKSVRRNLIISDLLARTKYVEKIGSGVKRMRQAVRKAGLKGPKFKFGAFFDIEFVRGGVSEGVSEGVNEGVNDKIIKVVNNTPGLRVPQIAKILNIPAKTIERHISLLNKENVIEFKGPSKSGGYF